MRIATYNINSIRARASNLFIWLKEKKPDVVFLQEIKCETNDFLYMELESLGYKSVAVGQKGYNGVAILCKYDFKVTNRKLPNFDDEEARYLEVLIDNGYEKFYAISVYAPNGCALDKNKEQEKHILCYEINRIQDKINFNEAENIRRLEVIDVTLGHLVWIVLTLIASVLFFMLLTL